MRLRSASMLLAVCCPCAFGDDMAVVVAERLSRLNHLIVEVTTEGYTAPLAASPFDRSQWRRTHGNAFLDRLTIVRPNVLHEGLTDTGAYVPTIASIHDGQLTARKLRPAASGRVAWTVSRRGLPENPYGARPLLWMFDLHMQDSPITQLNIARLFAEYPVARVRTTSEFSTFEVTVPMDSENYDAHYEFDINPRGTPLRSVVRLEFRTGALPATWTLYTLATREINGAELCTEALATVHNPNVAVPSYGLWHLRVTNAAIDRSLTDDDVRLAFDPRNAGVFDATLGQGRSDVYDADGNLIESIPTRFLLTPEEEAQYATAAGGGPGPAARPGAERTWVPVLAAGGGIAAAVVLGLARPRKAA